MKSTQHAQLQDLWIHFFFQNMDLEYFWKLHLDKQENLNVHTLVSSECVFLGAAVFRNSPSASWRSWGAGQDPVDSPPLWPRPESHTWESEGGRQLAYTNTPGVCGSHSISCQHSVGALLGVRCFIFTLFLELFLQTHAKPFQTCWSIKSVCIYVDEMKGYLYYHYNILSMA